MFATRFGSGVTVVAVAATLLTMAAPVALALNQADEGNLDATWDTDGLRAFSVTPLASDVANAVAIQPDGKTVIAGGASGSGSSICLIARLGLDGSDDPSFNGHGSLKAVINDNCTFSSVAIQPDGKIVLAGTTYDNGQDEKGLIARYNANGTPDSSFGTNGLKQLSSTIGNVELYGLALQADGKVVVAGELAEPSGGELYAARLKANGKIDKSFATNGVFAHQFTNVVGSNYSAFRSVALQSDGRIVLAGYSSTTTSVFALERLTSSGALDNSFSGDGRIGIPFSATANANAVAVTPDGNIVAAGIVTPSQNEYALAEVDTHGVLVDGFGDHGTVSQPVGDGNSSIAGMAVQRDGKIVLVGNTLAGTEPLMGAARYLPGGTPDSTFDDDGFYAPASDAPLFGNAVAIGRDGKITAVGLAQTGSDPSLIATFRLHGDNTPPTAAKAKAPKVFTLKPHVTLHLSSSDLNTGLAGFIIGRFRAPFGGHFPGGPSELPGLYPATSIKAGKSGVNDCFAATPVDRAGNLGAGVLDLCTAYPVDDRKLSASGKWHKVKGKHYYRHTALTTHAKGQHLVLKGGSYGTLALFATTCKTCGKVKVTRGATSFGTFNLASTHTHRRVKITVESGTTVQSGKITITTKSSKPVTIDAVGLSLTNT